MIARIIRSGAVLLLGLSAGCATPTTAPSGLDLTKLLTQAGGPLVDFAALQHGRLYLLYPIASFANKNGRFPKDYTELSDYVQESNGYLLLGQYEKVTLLPLTDGRLEVHYVSKDHTNEVSFTMGPATERN